MAKGIKYTAEEKIEIIETIKPYLQLGYSLKRACEYAGVPYSTIQNWLPKDEKLSSEIKAWQGMVNTQARQNIVEHIMGNTKKGIKPDLDTSKWWAERRERDDFSVRQENINTERSIKEVIDEFQDPDNFEYADNEEKTDKPLPNTNEGGEEKVLSA